MGYPANVVPLRCAGTDSYDPDALRVGDDEIPTVKIGTGMRTRRKATRDRLFIPSTAWPELAADHSPRKQLAIAFHGGDVASPARCLFASSLRALPRLVIQRSLAIPCAKATFCRFSQESIESVQLRTLPLQHRVRHCRRRIVDLLAAHRAALR